MANLQTLSILQSESGRGNGALAILLESSAILRFLELNSGWEPKATEFTYNVFEETSTAPARALNGNYTASDRERPDPIAGVLRNHGDAVSTDISLLADAAKSLNDANAWLEAASATKVKSYGAKIEALLFKGSGSGSNFKGLLEILDGDTDIPGFDDYTGVADAADVAASGEKSLDISTEAGQKSFVEYLRIQLALVDNPLGIWMNPSVWARINTIATTLKMVTAGGNDQFGKPVMLFDGVPIIQTLANSITLDEPDNTPTTPLNVTTSVYIVSPGEKRLSLATNSGFYYVDHNHIANTAKGQEWFEIRFAWMIAVKNAIRRIRNIKL